MFVPITFPSAMYFWLNGTNRNYIDKYTLEKRKLADLPAGFDCRIQVATGSEIASEYSLGLPLHIMVPDERHKYNTENTVCHVRPAFLPSGSFVILDKLTVVASPELCFVLAARSFSIPMLVKLGHNLCSRYVLDTNKPTNQRFREPICNVKTLNEYVERCGNIEGVKKARIALRYVMDNSNSPMESNLSSIIGLKKGYGGYGITGYALNSQITLPESARKILGLDKVSSDIVWSSRRVVIEYDSNLTHLEREQHAYDKGKLNALKLAGFDVMSLTSDNVRSLDTLDVAMDILRAKLGLRSEAEAMKKYHEKRKKTFFEIFRTDSFGMYYM